jgi:hypothetical protein
MTDRELFRQALEALNRAWIGFSCDDFDPGDSALVDAMRANITAMRERLAQPNREWVGLTEEDLFDIASVNFGEPDLLLFVEMGKLVQKELKELNT